MVDLGFECRGKLNNGHIGFEHPRFGSTEMGSTPSDVRWRENHRRKVASLMGLTKHELEVRVGVRPEKHQGPKVKRERNEAGRQARRFTVVRDDGSEQPPVRVGTPADRMKSIVSDRIEAEGRQMRSEPGSAAYNCALDDVARCRREWLEAESQMKEAA